MTKNRLVLNKTIVANLSDAEGDQIKGGTTTLCSLQCPSDNQYGCITCGCGTLYSADGGHSCGDYYTGCCGSTYADCTTLYCK